MQPTDKILLQNGYRNGHITITKTALTLLAGPPHSDESEQATLGAMMIDESALTLVLGALERHDFYRSNHRVIFDAISSLHAASQPVDFITLSDEIRKSAQLEEVGGVAYLAELHKACPSSKNVETYMESVRKAARRRELIQAANEAQALAARPDATPAEIEAVGQVLAHALENVNRTTKARFPVLTLADIFARPRLNWLVQDILLERGTTLITADYGAFKSFQTLSMLLSIATGTDWHGREVKSGTVVYVIAEGAYTTADRVKAWCIRHQRDVPENFHVIETPIQIADADQRAQLIEILRPLAPSIVAIDTIAKCNLGGDENSSKEMGLFTDGMEAMVRELDTQVLGVHHNNKNGGARGSNSLPANTDAHISLKRSAGNVVTFKCERLKNSEFESFSLIGRKVELPERDEYGRPVTSLVFDPTDTPATAAKPELTPTQNRALELLPAEGASWANWIQLAEENQIAISNFLQM